ncbi:MAG: hypothetical protein ACLGIT_18425 [Gammaproteobacteria bacterium]
MESWLHLLTAAAIMALPSSAVAQRHAAPSDLAWPAHAAPWWAHGQAVPPLAWRGPASRAGWATALPSCYRIGRCSLDDIVRHLDRIDELDRLAPSPPPPPPAWVATVRQVAPTDPRHVQPAYTSAGQVRPQFELSGRVRE